VETTVAIAESTGADPSGFVRVDLSGGGLTGRSTKLTLRPDGTLSAFNATSTGEAGQVLSAVISLGTTLASLGAGGPAVATTEPRLLECTDETAQLVARLDQVENDLRSLRASVAQGHEPPAAVQALAGLTAELAAIVDRLTLSTQSAVLHPTRVDFPGARGSATREFVAHTPAIPAAHYAKWFGATAAEEALREARVLGREGFRLSIRPAGPMFDILGDGDGGAGPPTQPVQRTRRFFYRRPVPASVSVVPCLEPWPSQGSCTADPSPAASARKTVLLPQLSGHFSLPIGRSNLFGTRTTSATFDERGAPLTLEYGSSRGGSDIAGVLNATNAGVTSLRDSDTAADTRRIAAIKAERELAALLAAPQGQ
jgi:hypothetical protein